MIKKKNDIYSQISSYVLHQYFRNLFNGFRWYYFVAVDIIPRMYVCMYVCMYVFLIPWIYNRF